MGNLILQTILKDSDQTIDLSNQEKGLYLYRVVNQKEKVSTRKIILQ